MEDILLTDGFELQFENGKLVRGESAEQHQHLLLVTNKGDWRFNETSGVGVRNFIKDEDEGLLLPEIKEQFERDGMRVEELRIDGESIYINAPYRNG